MTGDTVGIAIARESRVGREIDVVFGEGQERGSGGKRVSTPSGRDGMAVSEAESRKRRLAWHRAVS